MVIRDKHSGVIGDSWYDTMMNWNVVEMWDPPTSANAYSSKTFQIMVADFREYHLYHQKLKNMIAPNNRRKTETFNEVKALFSDFILAKLIERIYSENAEMAAFYRTGVESSFLVMRYLWDKNRTESDSLQFQRNVTAALSFFECESKSMIREPNPNVTKQNKMAKNPFFSSLKMLQAHY